MPSLGGWEWVILAVVALVLFGGSRLAGFGKSAGRAIREFKDETSQGKQPAKLDSAGSVGEAESQPVKADKPQPHEA